MQFYESRFSAVRIQLISTIFIILKNEEWWNIKKMLFIFF